MGLQGVLGSISIIVIGLVFLSIFAPTFINNFVNQVNAWVESIKQTSTTNFLQSKPIAGQVWCNLRVDVYGQLDNPNPFSLNVYFGRSSYHPETATYNWFSCYTTNSFINQLPPTDSLAIGSGDSVTIQLVFQGDDGSKVDASVQPLLLQKIVLPNGVFPTPYSFQQTFVVTNIPKQHYNMQIFVGRAINDMAVGVPFTKDINPK